MSVKKQTYVTINDSGQRIGQDHPKSVLTDLEVDALIRDRGPDDAPVMSYNQLARKYGISKSSVRDILTGRRRGLPKVLVKRMGTNRPAEITKVRVDLRVSLRARAILHRLGGGKWIDMLASRIDYEMRRAPMIDEKVAAERVLLSYGVVK